MTDLILQMLRPLSLLLSLIAGGCIYLILLNRYLLLLSDSRFKKLVLRGVLLVIGAASALFGWWAAGRPWMALPAGVCLAVVVGEVHRAAIRRRYAGEGPVHADNAGVTLGSPLTTTDLAVYRYRLATPNRRGAPLRIAHVSDLHLNGDLPTAYYRATLERVAQARPDLLFYTGDLVTRPEYAAELPGLLDIARGRLATIAVLGNHEYWVGHEPVVEALTAAGILWLSDRIIRLEHDGQTIAICGYEAPWSRVVWQPPRARADELALILTHTPDNIYRLSGLGYTAVFAGHYHGGQVRLPWFGPIIIPSRYGRRFDHGHYVVNGTHLFITAGVGSAVPPRRIYCKPDVFIVDIVAAQGEG
ncbi:MAG: metallophosphoesterase [Anaerolineae bacterium]